MPRQKDISCHVGNNAKTPRAATLGVFFLIIIQLIRLRLVTVFHLVKPFTNIVGYYFCHNRG